MNSVIWCPISRIVRDYLIEKDQGGDYQEVISTPEMRGMLPIATEAMPAEPAVLLAIFSEASIKKTRTRGSGIIEDPQVSMILRHTNPEAGRFAMKRIQDVMDSLYNWTWTYSGSSPETYAQTVVFRLAIRQRGIFNIGKDEKGRWQLNLEYQLVVQSVSGSEAQGPSGYYDTGWYCVSTYGE